MLYSYDVFNTLITRLCGSPFGIFSIMEERLQHDQQFCDIPVDLRNSFFHSRICLENDARNQTPDEDIIITDIYEYIGKIFNLSPGQMERLITLEIDTEYAYCVPVKQTIEKVRLYIKQGERVCLLSDMYLRKRDIETLLQKAAPGIVSYCPLFVSSELKKTKKRGTLYDFIIRKYGIPPGEIIHTGDNFYSDVFIPQKKGMKTIHHKFISTIKNEEYTYLQAVDSGRISCELSSEISHFCALQDNHPVRNCGSAIAGPLLAGFMQWLVRTIKKDSPKASTVYFLARDGDILLEAAGMLDEWKDFPYEKKYLSVSQQSALFAVMTEFNAWVFGYLLKRYPKVNVSMIAQRCMIDDEELCSYFSIKPGKKDKWLTLREIGRIKNIFLTNKDLQKKILNNSFTQFQLFKEYLEQEGVFDQPEIVLVDLGWQYTIQDSLHILMNRLNRKHTLRGYYFGITKYTDLTNKDNQKKAFLFYPFSPNRIFKKRYYVVFLELFSSSLDEVTTHYRKEGSHSIPVKQENRISLSWIPDIRKGIHDYITAAQRYNLYDKINYREVCLYIMYKLNHPVKRLVDTLGKLPYSADPFDSDAKPIAPSLKLKDLFKPEVVSRWVEGSLLRSRRIYRIFIKIKKRIDRMNKKR